ncbi:MAG TPA: DUF177 domain-containing protein [Candidatus Limnocylindria bacterium]|nr:DUF177 domain-containing protein [Candidatus Limnocylindria bacterium]
MTSFNVAGLLQEPPGEAREARLRDRYVALGPDVELAGPLDADLRLQRTNRGILVRGRVQAPILRTCARCLDTFVEDVEVTLDEEYLPTIDPASGAPVGIAAEDAEIQRIDAHHEVDLRPLLHDELALTEPMHPLCRPDCPGLCTVCGRSLADGPHDHAEDDIDPRLAGLAALLDRDD